MYFYCKATLSLVVISLHIELNTINNFEKEIYFGRNTASFTNFFKFENNFCEIFSKYC